MKLPCETCGGKCCGPVPFNKKELKRLKRLDLLPKKFEAVSFPLSPNGKLILNPDDLETCPFLKDGKCSIYEHRPKVCRLMGEIPELPCPEINPVESERLASSRWDKLKRWLFG